MLNTKGLFIVLLNIGIQFISNAQEGIDYTAKDFIKTVQFSGLQKNDGFPIVALGEKFRLKFDDLNGDEINEEDLVDKNVRYEINATYWVKLPKPTFGAHFIKLKSDSDPKSVQGVQVIAVIKGSPAENAGVQKNDSITSVSGKLVENPDDLINAIKKNKGKSIEIGYIRNGKQSKVSVKL